MIPEFTADASLTRARAAYAPARRSAADGTSLITPQAFFPADEQTLRRGGSAEWGGTGTTISCPGCAQHACGFLGLHTCLTCC